MILSHVLCADRYFLGLFPYFILRIHHLSVPYFFMYMLYFFLLAGGSKSINFLQHDLFRVKLLRRVKACSQHVA